MISPLSAGGCKAIDQLHIKVKNEPTRFLGEGVSFKAKLIGILEVSEARGDRMCQAALADLKMAIRAAGEHKQRIAVQVSIDGLRLKEEKTGECLYHHPVHKISFIAQDMSDSRAFGYIFGSPDIGHRFFGIKTDKAASQVVIAMRDLFQVVFELKKKEIELAKQHIEQNTINAIKFHTSGIFVEPSPDTKGAAGTESSLHRLRSTASEVEKPVERKNESQSGVIADLLDLQFELNSLQQGIHEMDKITPENPVASTDDLLKTDPFGDSFANMKLTETVRPILPPPPSSKRGHLERQQTVPVSQTSTTTSPAKTLASKTPPPENTIHWFDKETENLFSDNELENPSQSTTETKEPEYEAAIEPRPKSPQIDVFTELDPLGTGLIKPYIDKKDFFQHLKNPPKKVLKDLVSTNSTDTFPTTFNIISDPLEPVKATSDSSSKSADTVEETNFANFDRFDENQASQSDLPLPASSPKKEAPKATHHQPLSVSLPPEEATIPKSSSASTSSVLARMDKDSTESVHAMLKLPSPKKYLQSVRKKEFDVDLSTSRAPSIDKPFPVDFSTTSDSPASPLRSCSSDANSRLSSSSAELELVPEPPPRGVGSVLLNPPPLPPKKQSVRSGIKPPPRLTHPEGYFHYDFPEQEPVSSSPTRTKEKLSSPPREIKGQFDDDFSPPLHLIGRSYLIGSMTPSTFEQSFSSMIPTTSLSSFFTATSTPASSKKTKPSLDITLSQLTSSNLDELANSLGMTVQQLTSLTLQQLTECLARLSVKEASTSNDSQEVVTAKPEEIRETESQTPAKIVEQTSFTSSQSLFKTGLDQEPKQDTTYDKYAVFRELFEMERLEQREQSEETDAEETNVEETSEENIAKEQESQEETEIQAEMQNNGTSADSLASLVNLTVKLPPSSEELIAKEDAVNNEEIEETFSTLMIEKDQPVEPEEKEEEVGSDSSTKQAAEEDLERTMEIEDRTNLSDRGSDPNGRILAEGNAEEINGAFALDKVEVKSSTSTSSDKYAALREIIGEPEPPSRKSEEEAMTPTRVSPVIQPPSKSLAEVELLNLFSDALPVPSSPKKKEEDLKAVAMDIFEEIKMLNTGVQSAKDSKPQISGFEDVFCPFGTETRQDELKDDANWGKFDAGVFGSDRSSCEGPRSVGGTSPWSPDGKEFHREASYKSSVHRHSGDSDNEWKDEEESEESNGRVRGDGRFWYGRHPRFEAGAFEDRSFYEEAPGDKRDRSFRDRMGRKSRGAPWSKATGHRPRDPSPWHEECQWEEEPRRYPHRKMPYKDDEEQYEGHWKCRPKPQGRWNWGHEHGSFYDDERKRKLMLWNEEDRFGSQESMGYDEDDRWSRRKYERRRWEEDARFWGRRTGPPESEYPMRETYYYYRESRERPHDYPTAWDEEYTGDRPADDSPRYNPSGRKRHWPKRPNSANEGRNADMVYPEPRGKFGASRSECSDIDSDPYLRPSQRSRSRESYWGSDQEFDSWAERPYWSEGPDSKSESLHRKRIARHKPRTAQTKTQSPFEDDFGPSVEQVESPVLEALPAVEPRMRVEADQKPAPSSPSPRCSKEHPRREPPREYAGKRSSYFEDDLTPTASASSDASDRQRLSSDLKATPEELPCDSKDRSIDGFAAEDAAQDAFFNGDLRYEDDAFAFKSELEDNVPDHKATTLPLKNSRQTKYPGNNNNNSKARGDQYIRKSESVNIFVRKNDPFDDDDFFN
ncbi:hypothetical protein KM043_007589 [Ampulex compressa]|nr:hypothetical protein KM043_007589 [Ampulex compressa]